MKKISDLTRRVILGSAAVALAPYIAAHGKNLTEEIIQNLKPATVATSTLNPGNSKNIISPQTEELGPQTYAVMANGQGISSSGTFSESNNDTSIKGMFSLYDLLHNKGVSNNDIDLFLYHHSDKVPEFCAPAIKGEIDGVSSLDNFENSLRKMKKVMRPQDRLILSFSNPSYIESEGAKHFDREVIHPTSVHFYFGAQDQDMSSSNLYYLLSHIKGEKIIFGQLPENGNFVLGMYSPGAIINGRKLGNILDNTLVISAGSKENNDFLTQLSYKIQKNPEESLGKIVDSLKDKYDIRSLYFKGGNEVPLSASKAYTTPLFPEASKDKYNSKDAPKL